MESPPNDCVPEAAALVASEGGGGGVSSLPPQPAMARIKTKPRRAAAERANDMDANLMMFDGRENETVWWNYLKLLRIGPDDYENLRLDSFSVLWFKRCYREGT